MTVTMSISEFTLAERATIEQGLTLAAYRYDEDAKVCTEQGFPRLAEQFEKQAREARAVIAKLTTEDA